MTATPHISPVPKIPEPRLRMVRNLTPFAMFQCDKMGPGRRYYDVVVIKATYDLETGALVSGADATPVALADSYHDAENPERSSVAIAGDLVVMKPATDVLIRGSVRPAGGRRTERWDVSLGIHDAGRVKLQARFAVCGPRRWKHTALRGWRLSEPEPTDKVPIRYEFAYGGSYLDPDANGEHPTRKKLAANPCGSGHWDPRTLDKNASYAGPQWEEHGSPVTGLLSGAAVAGLGPVARWWSSRLVHMGTYDADWMARSRAEAERGLAMDYATDFDTRYFQCAHPKLACAEHLRGDEAMVLIGMLPEAGPFYARLPGVRLIATVLANDARWYDHALPLDTVTIDLERRSLSLVWRLTIHQEFDVRCAILTMEKSA